MLDGIRSGCRRVSVSVRGPVNKLFTPGAPSRQLSFVVSQETASRISAILPPDRYISISAAKNDDEDESDEDESDEDDDDDNGNKKKSSVFQRYQPKLSDREKEQAKRIAKALSKSKK